MGEGPHIRAYFLHKFGRAENRSIFQICVEARTSQVARRYYGCRLISDVHFRMQSRESVDAGFRGRIGEHLQVVTEVSPGNAQGWSNMGIVFLQLERYPEAIDALGQSLALAPGQESVIAAREAAQGRLG